MKYYAIDSTVSLDKADDAQALRAAFHMDQDLIFFKNRADAVLAAKRDVKPTSDIQNPIYEIEFDSIAEEDLDKVEVKVGRRKISAFSVLPNDVKDFTLLNASFNHVDKQYNVIDLTPAKEKAVETKAKEETAKDTKAENKPEDKKEETAKAANNNYTVAAGAAVATAVVATGFWFSGFYPAAIAMLAKAGLALPAAAIGVQIGVCAAVGVAAVAVLGAAYYGISKLLGSETPAEPVVDNRTEAQKYSDKLKSKEDKIKARSEKLTSTEDKKFLTDLQAILDIEHTAERKFKKDGDLMKNQPTAVDKLLVLKYEAKRLKEVVAAEGADRTKLETAILDTAKKDAAKKFVA